MRALSDIHYTNQMAKGARKPVKTLYSVLPLQEELFDNIHCAHTHSGASEPLVVKNECIASMHVVYCSSDKKWLV